MSFLKKGYEDLWKSIIRPPRDIYTIEDLGPAEFEIKHKIFKRTDFQLKNSRGLTLECSYFEPTDEDRVAPQLPCVIYLHGNCSSRVEALPAVQVLLPDNITVFSFDMAGSGLSEGEYISLGWYERDDVDCVVQYLRNSGKITCIGLWGRSMGAVTALLHIDRDPSIAGAVLDSPFANLRQLAEELAKSYTKLPGFMLSAAISLIRKTIKKKAAFNIDDLNPLDHVSQSFIPVTFIAAKDDTFILPSHTQSLYEKYSGEKTVKIVDGDHNSARPEYVMDSITIFFHYILQCESLPQSPPKKKNKRAPKLQSRNVDFIQAIAFQDSLVSEEDLIAQAIQESLKLSGPQEDDVSGQNN
jgi:pimeloyl-ACP methyl ester carboxylesterase